MIDVENLRKQFGSTVARVQGPVDRTTPPFISLCYTCTHGPYNEPGPGFLGTSFAPFRPMGPSRNDMVPPFSRTTKRSVSHTSMMAPTRLSHRPQRSGLARSY